MAQERCDSASLCMQAAAVVGAPLDHYFEGVTKKLQRLADSSNKPPSDFPGHHTLALKLRLTRSGILAWYATETASGNPVIDHWVEKLFRRAEPFQPLPTGLLEEGFKYLELKLSLELEGGVIKQIANEVR